MAWKDRAGVKRAHLGWRPVAVAFVANMVKDGVESRNQSHDSETGVRNNQ